MSSSSTDNQLPAPADGGNETDPRVIWGGTAAILAVLAAIFFFTHGETNEKKEKSASAQNVTVVTVQPQSFAKRITLSGEARPRVDVRVFAPISGVRITQLLVDEGATVKQGQPLAQLDARVAMAQLSAAQASVAEAESAQVRTADEYKRAELIRDSGALSAEAISARQAAAKAAEARLAAARAQLSELNARMEGGYVRAPNAGLVIERHAQVGQLVDGQALFRIAGDNALEVGVEISEADMLALKPGMPATFFLVDGSSVTGKMRHGPAAIDSKTRSGEAVFDLPRDPKLRAGMVLRGDATLPPRQSLAAPQTAVTYVDRQASVFVLTPDNRVHRRPVVVGQRSGDMVAIEQGLEPGQTVVSGGAAFLQDGDAVTPVRGTISANPTPEKDAELHGRNGG